jgi:hypothetical protein
MYLAPHSFLTPLGLFGLGFAAVALGVVLMLEAGRASANGASPATVERTGSIGAWTVLTGIATLAIAALWAALS